MPTTARTQDAATKIPDGPASTYLKVGAALAALIGVEQAVAAGDHTATTLGAGAAAVSFLVTFAAGKYAQAAALYRSGRQ